MRRDSGSGVVEVPCGDGAPSEEGALDGEGFPDGSVTVSKPVRKRTLRDCGGSQKTVWNLNKSIAVVGKHFL